MRGWQTFSVKSQIDIFGFVAHGISPAALKLSYFGVQTATDNM